MTIENSEKGGFQGLRVFAERENVRVGVLHREAPALHLRDAVHEARVLPRVGQLRRLRLAEGLSHLCTAFLIVPVTWCEVEVTVGNEAKFVSEF